MVLHQDTDALKGIDFCICFIKKQQCWMVYSNPTYSLSKNTEKECEMMAVFVLAVFVQAEKKKEIAFVFE